jgi:hypothetical protein
MRVLIGVVVCFSSFSLACSSTGSGAGGSGAFGTGAQAGAAGSGGDAGGNGGTGGIGVGGVGATGGIINTGGISGGGGGEVVSSLELERVWYIASQGQNALIDFNQVPPKVTCGPPVGESDGFEGTGVFTNPTSGELYFYTDGRKVFHGTTHQLLANGDGLSGHVSATEPALIAPKFGSDDKQFYIFTNNTDMYPPSTISYSIMDLTQGPNGTVVEKNTVLATGNVGEALDLLPHTDGQSFWVLGYDTAANIQAFSVGKNGLSTTPVKSPTGLTGEPHRGAINHTEDYDTLVLAMNYGGPSGLIATASFDRTTGMVSNVKQIVTGDLGYHASFSPDGTKLYYVRGSEGWLGTPYQWDLTTGTETQYPGFSAAAAKLAPDGKLYWAIYNATSLAVVDQPNEPGAAANYNATGLSLEGCVSGFGLPNQTAAYLEYLPPIPR